MNLRHCGARIPTCCTHSVPISESDIVAASMRKYGLINERNITMTIKTENIDHLVKQISNLLPQDLRRTREDIEKNIKTALTASLKKMDLVTREEFDIQQELLANTRKLLNELETKITVLENQLKKGSKEEESL